MLVLFLISEDIKDCLSYSLRKAKMSISHLTKCQLVMQWEVIFSNFRTPPPNHQRNVEIVGLLWMNQHQHCVHCRGWGVDRKAINYVGKSVPRLLTRIVTLAVKKV